MKRGLHLFAIGVTVKPDIVLPNLTLSGFALETEVVCQSLGPRFHWSATMQSIHPVQQHSAWTILYGLFFIICDSTQSRTQWTPYSLSQV